MFLIVSLIVCYLGYKEGLYSSIKVILIFNLSDDVRIYYIINVRVVMICYYDIF